MNPIEIKLTISIDEELDEVIYGGFYLHTRNNEGRPFVQIKEGDAWIPVNDWKDNRYVATEDKLKRIAKHFIEIGKHIKEDEK